MIRQKPKDPIDTWSNPAQQQPLRRIPPGGIFERKWPSRLLILRLRRRPQEQYKLNLVDR